MHNVPAGALVEKVMKFFFKKDGDHTIKLTRRMKLWHFSANMSTDDDGDEEVKPGIHGRLQVPNFDLAIIGPAHNSLTVEPAHQID